MEDQKHENASPIQVEDAMTVERHQAAKKLDTMGWALFFIWVGIAFLADFDIGLGLLGIGVIILAIQFARRRHDLKFEGFWIVVGVLFVLGGLWELFETDLPLIPILLITVGVILLVSAALKKNQAK